MKITNNQKAIEILRELEDRLTERISDLHEVKLGVEARHSFMFYRDYVWQSLAVLRSITEKESEK